jgi:hypothetical protein
MAYIWRTFGVLCSLIPRVEYGLSGRPAAPALSWIEVGYKYSFSLDGIPPVDIFELRA